MNTQGYPVGRKGERGDLAGLGNHSSQNRNKFICPGQRKGEEDESEKTLTDDVPY